MKKYLNLIATIIIIATLIFNTYTTTRACDEQIHIVYNNKEVDLPDGYPIVYKDRVFLGLRSTANMLNMNTEWNSKTQTALIYNKNKSIIIKVNMKSKQTYVNDELAKMSTPPMIIDGRIFVPVRFIAETFYKKVVYVSETRIIHINDSNMQQSLY